jgi:hypothetical protein
LLLTAAFAAAVAIPSLSLSQGFASSGWLDAAGPRPAPDSRYFGEDCSPSGPADCRLKAWRDLLAARGHTELSAPAGGRSYRYLVDHYDHGLGLKIVRLDVAADGKATFTASYPRGRATARPLSGDVVTAFEAALAKSRFSAAGVQKVGEAVCEGDETVFEAVVGGRYKVVIEPCGDEAGLDKAMAVLDGEG